MNVAIIDADIIGRKKHRFPNLACMKLSFREFCHVAGQSALRYMTEFEAEYPEIAKLYFDMKWGEIDC